jgi:hypothetical protein
VPSAARSGEVEGNAENPWKFTAQVLTNPSGVNIPKWRLLVCNSLYFKDGHFSKCSSIRVFLIDPLCTCLVNHRDNIQEVPGPIPAATTEYKKNYY